MTALRLQNVGYDAPMTPEERAAMRVRYPVSTTTRYADDPAAQRFVADHPDGATLAEIAATWGCHPENVRQAVQKASANFTRRLAFVLRGHPL